MSRINAYVLGEVKRRKVRSIENQVMVSREKGNKIKPLREEA